MSHVAEGQLHAYLDGDLRAHDPAAADALERHVDGCAECAARLREATALRGDAASILSGAAPADVEGPPFEMLRQRAAARRAERTRPAAKRTRTLAWAASLAAALILGWYARAIVAPPFVPGEEAAVERADAGADDPASAADLRGANAASEPVASPPPAEPPAPATTPAGLGRADRPAEEVREQEVRRERVEALADAAESKAVAPASAPPPPAAAAEGAALEQTVAAWTPVSRGQAERRLGGPVPTVPGLEVLDIAVPTLAADATVRVRQRLPSGAILVLVLEPLAERQVAERSMVAAAAEPRVLMRMSAETDADETVAETQVVIERLGYRLVGRAAVTVDSIRTLLDRVR